MCIRDRVKLVRAANPKTVMVLVSSFPYTIDWSQQHVPAILHIAHASQDEGTALSRVLFGQYNPGGHLVSTWPKSSTKLLPMMDYDIRHGRTYMYARERPLYPFGHGLSYTTFKYLNLRIDNQYLPADGMVNVTADVINTGKQTGDTVVQLYVKYPASNVGRPKQALAGFERLTLAPGEKRTVSIPLKASQLAYWDATTKMMKVELAPLGVMLGESSASIQLVKTIAVRRP